MKSTVIPKQKPISKEKVKEVLDIMDVAHAFSGEINERPRQPLILCPFHNDRHLGSCRVYRDTNIFYCESCQTGGDVLKLASGYMEIPLSDMNELLEAIVSTFGIFRESVEVDSNRRPSIRKKDLLSAEEYQLLNAGKEYFEIPVEFDTFEFEDDCIEYWPVQYQKIYFRNLALKDPQEHDWVICAITRTRWFESKKYIAECYRDNRMDQCSFTIELVKLWEDLLYKAVLNKRTYHEEMAARKRDLKEMLAEEGIWPIEEKILKGA